MKRFGDSRRSRALQTDALARIQRWLDFAALLPFDEKLPPPWEASAELMDRILVTSAGLKQIGSTLAATRFPAYLFFPMGAIFDRAQAAREFYRFFWTVRSSLEWMIETWANRDHWPESLESKRESPSSSFGIPFAQQITMNRRSGKVSVLEGPPWGAFKMAIDGLELERLRRCPVCRQIYYAGRKNKGACDQHLGLARVRRKRGKTAEYNENRRFRRKMRIRAVRGKERAKVLALSTALKTEDKDHE
jgi:hypothetical protein